MRRLGLWCACVLLLAGPATAAQGSKPAAQTAHASVNVNTASEVDLEALPGVGPATAKKIIAGRPFASAADLAKAGVPQATVEKITPLVTFGGGRSTTAPPAAPAASPSPSSTSAVSAQSSRGSAANASAVAQQPPAKGMVWVNLDTKVFHREGDRYYGKTKNGKFMTEADAAKAGYHEAKVGAAKPSGKS
ncbi:MAG: helix-hairpin-helix domain-containing protein [Vicinamibacterales bacterium]